MLAPSGFPGKGWRILIKPPEDRPCRGTEEGTDGGNEREITVHD